MRTFLIFLGLFAVAAAISGLITYPAWSLLQTFADVPVHRVMNRIGMLVLAVTTILFLRRQGLANRETLGYGMPRPLFIRQMLFGFAAGVLLMMPLVAAIFGFELRTLSAKFIASEAQALFVAKLILQGLLTGWVVAFLEETFCRGAMYTVIQRESGLLAAILLPTFLYAATHFLGGELRLPADQVTYLSGLQVTANLFERFATPWEFFDSFLALSALGVLLAFIRMRTNAIAGCIGLHAGGVTVIVTMRNLSTVDTQHSMHWLVGNYDGVIGWMALVWISVVAAIYWKVSKRTA
jgi:uncharacterized protein